MSYRDYLPQRLDPQGIPVFPIRRPASIDKPAQGMSDRQGQDAQRLGAKPASPARQGAANPLSKDHPHAR